MKNRRYSFLWVMFMLFAAFAVAVLAATAPTPPKTAPQPTPTGKAPLPMGARPVAPKVIAGPPPFAPLPGEFAIQKVRWYLTARDGGHHSIDAITTAATTIGPYEKFRLASVQPDFTTIQTAGGYYLTAGSPLGGQHDPTQVVQTEVTSPTQTESALFRFQTHGDAWNVAFFAGYTIQTFGGYFLTALGNGGKATGAFHSDARTASGWEHFELVKCGDLGSGYDYVMSAAGYPTSALMAPGGGGRVKPGLILANLFNGASAAEIDWTRIKLIRQSDGSYALQTSNGINFVTAIRGGGIAHSPADWDNLVTDRTQVQAWERFKIVDRGDCTYTIQTVDGWYVAYGPSWDISTRISDPNAAPTIGYNPSFKVRMRGRP